MKIAIHQPNFFPHYPFFQKMKEADVFVLLCHCQFEKNNYQNRFKMNDEWFTMRVNHGLKPIIEKAYIAPTTDFDKIKLALPEYEKLLDNFDDCMYDSLAKTNSEIIERIAYLLKIKTQIVFDYPTVLTGTERLVHLCKNWGATTYLSGISGIDYMDMKLFEKEDIEVLFQQQQESKPILQVL